MKSFEPFLGKLSPLSETAVTCFLGMKITQTLQETRILAHIGPTCGSLFFQILQFFQRGTLVQVIIFWFLPFSQEIYRVPIVLHSRDIFVWKFKIFLEKDFQLLKFSFSFPKKIWFICEKPPTCKNSASHFPIQKVLSKLFHVVQEVVYSDQRNLPQMRGIHYGSYNKALYTR